MDCRLFGGTPYRKDDLAMITNITYLFDTNGLLIGTQQTVMPDQYATLENGLMYGFAFAALLMGFWAVKGVWNSFLGADRQED